MKCLEDKIGLSDNMSKCFERGRPTNSSKGEIFIDEKSGISISEISDCESDPVWDIYEGAKKKGLREMKADFNSMMNKIVVHKNQPFSGFLGERSVKQIHDVDGEKAIVVIECKPIKGAYLTIKDLGLVLNESHSDITVELKSNINEEVIKTFQISSSESRFKLTEVETTTLPMYSKSVETVQYYLIYSFQGAKPHLTSVNCGCNGLTSYFDHDKPIYDSTHPDKDSWANYVMIGSYDFDGENVPPTYGELYAETLGLNINMEISCWAEDMLCVDRSNPQYEEILLCAQSICAHFVAKELLSGSVLNRVTVTNEQEMDLSRTAWYQEYKERLSEIVNNIKLTDCFTCKPNTSRKVYFVGS